MTRDAKVRLGVDDSQVGPALGRAKGKFVSWGREVAMQTTQALKSGLERVGTIAGVAGVAGIAMAVRETKKWNDRLVELGQVSNMSRGAVLQLNNEIQQAAVATGASQDELLQFVEKFQEITGRVDEAKGSMEQWGRIAKATGAGMADIAGVAAALSQNLGVSDEQMGAMFDTLSAQSDKGAIKMKNMAMLVPALSAEMSHFGATGTKAGAELGAMLQVGRLGAGDAAEASTQLIAALDAVAKHADKLRAHGVEVFTDKTHTHYKDAIQIFDEIAKKIPQLDKIQKIFGREEGIKFLTSFEKHRDLLAELVTEADKAGTNERKFGQYAESASGKIDRFSASIHKTFNEAFLSHLDAIADAFGVIAKAVGFLFEHPLSFALPAFAALKTAPMALGLLGDALKGGGAAGGLGAGAAGLAGGQRVYVTNWPGGGFGGRGAGYEEDENGGAAGGAAAGGEGRRGPGIVQKVALVAMAAEVGISLGTLIAQDLGYYSTGASHSQKDFIQHGAYAADQLYRIAFGHEEDEDTGMGRDFGHAMLERKGSARELLSGKAEFRGMDFGNLSASQAAAQVGFITKDLPRQIAAELAKVINTTSKTVVATPDVNGRVTLRTTGGQ